MKLFLLPTTLAVLCFKAIALPSPGAVQAEKRLEEPRQEEVSGERPIDFGSGGDSDGVDLDGGNSGCGDER